MISARPPATRRRCLPSARSSRWRCPAQATSWRSRRASSRRSYERKLRHCCRHPARVLASTACGRRRLRRSRRQRQLVDSLDAHLLLSRRRHGRAGERHSRRQTSIFPSASSIRSATRRSSGLRHANNLFVSATTDAADNIVTGAVTTTASSPPHSSPTPTATRPPRSSTRSAWWPEPR